MLLSVNVAQRPVLEVSSPGEQEMQIPKAQIFWKREKEQIR